LCSSGKSGSLFYYTEDQKFMLKTISQDEFNKLKEILSQYYEHLTKNPESLMTRFYGMHKVKWRMKGTVKTVKKYLVIMNNVFRDFEVGERFDLKGSTVGRRTLDLEEPFENENRDKKMTLKDLDFNDSIRELRIKKPENGNSTFEDILEKDARFFG
jgi:1-phosphatidylinositol-4-phosphate 5-kinase